MSKEEIIYLDFLEHCIKNDNIHGICSFSDFWKETNKLKEDGFI